MSPALHGEPGEHHARNQNVIEKLRGYSSKRGNGEREGYRVPSPAAGRGQPKAERA
jgi:hypothetical protein